MADPLALIIEDDDRLAEIFDQALRVASFETEIVQNGDTALVRLAETTPALVLLDLHLPNVPGSKILHKIHANERLTETRVILTTGDVPMASSLRDEADLVLVKPISFMMLRDLAARLHQVGPN